MKQKRKKRPRVDVANLGWTIAVLALTAAWWILLLYLAR